MSQFLPWFLKLIGLAICSEIPVQAQLPSVSIYEGQSLAHIEVLSDSSDKQRETKHISLQKLSPKFQASFAAKKKVAELDYSAGVRVPLQKELPYSVPVLDQGQYGTCVTFATTSAVQAALGLGDKISQQCSLQLFLGLGQNYWNGAYYSSEIISPLQQYGASSHEKCPNKYALPSASSSSSSYAAYVDHSIDINRIKYVYHAALSIDQVKQAIDQGHYVTIGVGLLNSGDAISVQGFDVKVNNRKYAGGLWACKQKSSFSNYCATPEAGHELVVYGYDDAQQLLKIRNSWGFSSGYQGDFYMSYQFFSSMVFDGTEISAY